jgi:hypothetical protein
MDELSSMIRRNPFRFPLESFRHVELNNLCHIYPPISQLGVKALSPRSPSQCLAKSVLQDRTP